MIDIYLSSISNRMNEVMKVLTVIATIFMPLTFIAGVYGMNFKYMPELEWHWGYPAVLLVMAAVAAYMLSISGGRNGSRRQCRGRSPGDAIHVEEPFLPPETFRMRKILYVRCNRKVGKCQSARSKPTIQ